MHLVTDNKAALRAAVTRTSQRLSPWELIKGQEIVKRITPKNVHAYQAMRQHAIAKEQDKGRGE